MAIEKKKKRRKKRKPVEVELPQTEEEKRKIQYRDDFQKTVGQRVEDFFEQFAGKGRTFLYALIGLVAVGAVIGYFYYSSQQSMKAGETALGRAIETASARITDVPLPATSTEKVFKTKKARAEAAIKEFDAVIAAHGGAVAEKAAYFKAITQVEIDRAAGSKALADVAAKGGDAGSLAKFALAGINADDGKSDEAIKLYKELAAVENPVVSKVTINTELAKLLEKTGKKKEAVGIYFEIAKAASEAKDSQNKAIPLSQSENEAKAKLEELDPEKAKEIKEPEPDIPAGLPNPAGS